MTFCTQLQLKFHSIHPPFNTLQYQKMPQNEPVITLPPGSLRETVPIPIQRGCDDDSSSTRSKMLQAALSIIPQGVNWGTLTALHLSNCALVTVDVEVLNGTPCLEHIDLHGNRIVDVSPLFFHHNLPYLWTIDISFNAISDLSFLAKPCARHVGVGSVDLRANPLHFEQLRFLIRLVCIELRASFYDDIVRTETFVDLQKNPQEIFRMGAAFFANAGVTEEPPLAKKTTLKGRSAKPDRHAASLVTPENTFLVFDDCVRSTAAPLKVSTTAILRKLHLRHHRAHTFFSKYPLLCVQGDVTQLQNNPVSPLLAPEHDPNLMPVLMQFYSGMYKHKNFGYNESTKFSTISFAKIDKRTWDLFVEGAKEVDVGRFKREVLDTPFFGGTWERSTEAARQLAIVLIADKRYKIPHRLIERVLGLVVERETGCGYFAAYVAQHIARLTGIHKELLLWKCVTCAQQNGDNQFAKMEDYVAFNFYFVLLDSKLCFFQEAESLHGAQTSDATVSDTMAKVPKLKEYFEMIPRSLLQDAFEERNAVEEKATKLRKQKEQLHEAKIVQHTHRSVCETMCYRSQSRAVVKKTTMDSTLNLCQYEDTKFREHFFATGEIHNPNSINVAVQRTGDIPIPRKQEHYHSIKPTTFSPEDSKDVSSFFSSRELLLRHHSEVVQKAERNESAGRPRPITLDPPFPENPHFVSHSATKASVEEGARRVIEAHSARSVGIAKSTLTVQKQKNVAVQRQEALLMRAHLVQAQRDKAAQDQIAYDLQEKKDAALRKELQQKALERSKKEEDSRREKQALIAEIEQWKRGDTTDTKPTDTPQPEPTQPAPSPKAAPIQEPEPLHEPIEAPLESETPHAENETANVVSVVPCEEPKESVLQVTTCKAPMTYSRPQQVRDSQASFANDLRHKMDSRNEYFRAKGGHRTSDPTTLSDPYRWINMKNPKSVKNRLAPTPLQQPPHYLEETDQTPAPAVGDTVLHPFHSFLLFVSHIAGSMVSLSRKLPHADTVPRDSCGRILVGQLKKPPRSPPEPPMYDIPAALLRKNLFKANTSTTVDWTIHKPSHPALHDYAIFEDEILQIHDVLLVRNLVKVVSCRREAYIKIDYLHWEVSQYGNTWFIEVDEREEDPEEDTAVRRAPLPLVADMPPPVQQAPPQHPSDSLHSLESVTAELSASLAPTWSGVQERGAQPFIVKDPSSPWHPFTESSLRKMALRRMRFELKERVKAEMEESVPAMGPLDCSGSLSGARVGFANASTRQFMPTTIRAQLADGEKQNTSRPPTAPCGQTHYPIGASHARPVTAAAPLPKPEVLPPKFLCANLRPQSAAAAVTPDRPLSSEPSATPVVSTPAGAYSKAKSVLAVATKSIKEAGNDIAFILEETSMKYTVDKKRSLFGTSF